MNEESQSFIQWRKEARDLLIKGVAPQDSKWAQSQAALFSFASPLKPVPSPSVTPSFLSLARNVACARVDDRWSLLYRVLYRLHHESPNLLKIAVDPDVHRLMRLSKSVSRDIHKMHAFVRFKKAIVQGVETFVAWHNPEHLIMELGAPFFVRRFGDKPWSIFSPDGSAHWNLEKLTFGPGLSQREFEHEDPFDEIWKTYYKSIFNPARLKIKAMKNEMAPKYWAALPEAGIIQNLIRETPLRLQNMSAAPVFLAQPPRGVEWSEFQQAAKACKACPLATEATQTVLGDGPINAKLMIVGEQPGDQEDLTGKVFSGPSGELLNQALWLANVDRTNVYITNAVKHFKFVREGKARIHKKASGSEMHACKPWLEQEIARVRPQVILCLGATAAMAVYGRLVKIQAERGIAYKESAAAAVLLVSWHPSAILRSSNEEERQKRFNELLKDIKQAGAFSDNDQSVRI